MHLSVPTVTFAQKTNASSSSSSRKSSASTNDDGFGFNDLDGDDGANDGDSTPSAASGAVIVAQVSGLSEYCHYGQDGLADKGWGCAYRVLQTILTWYRLQGFLSERAHPHLAGRGGSFAGVPSHRALQSALVAAGDKPASIRGSQQWIGSVELAVALAALYGLRSRVLPCASGAAVRAAAPALVEHFATQGTPVMVGGGALALCVLGVAVHRASGDVRYLVLDPHYTGADAVEPVIKGGWCRWRGAETWSEGDFYNILLPQRPRALQL